MSRIQVTLGITKNDLSIICTESKIAQSNVLYSRSMKGLFIKNEKLHKTENIQKFVEECHSEIEIVLGHKVNKMLLTLEMEDLKIQRTEKTMQIINDIDAVKQEDIDNINKLATDVVSVENYETVYTKPFRYILDGKNVLNHTPLNYKCESLSVDMIIYSTKATLMSSVKKLSQDLNIKFNLIMPSQFGSAYESTSEMELIEGICVATIGYSSMNVSYFKQGCLINSVKISDGFNRIIKKLAHDMRLDQKTAYTIYTKIAVALTDATNKYQIHQSYDEMAQAIRKFSNLDIAKIVEAEIIELYKAIDEVAQEISPKPVRVAITGLLAKNKSCSRLLKVIETETEMRNYVPVTTGANEEVYTSALGMSYFSFITTEADEFEELLVLPVYREQLSVKNRFNTFFKRVIGIN